MKTLPIIVLLLGSLQPLLAQTDNKKAPFVYLVLADSSIVSGRIVRQDSSMIVLRKRNGDLSYLETYQVVRRSAEKPRRSDKSAEGLTTFSLKDGSTVYGRIVKRTPVAVVVRQQNGTQTYIDPGDILSMAVMTESPPAPGNFRASAPTDTLDYNVPAVPVKIPYLLNSRTAYTPGSGRVYYRNAYLVRNELEAGITDGWSIGVVFNPFITDLYKTSEYLTEAIYTNADYGTQLYTRIGIPVGKKIRVGAVLQTQLQKPNSAVTTRVAFQGQVLTTFGDQRSNVTLGYTFKLDDKQLYLFTEGALTIGTMQPLSPSLTFISDNSIKIKSSYSGPFAHLSAALRIHSRNHSFDLGVLSSVSQRYSYYSTNFIAFNVYPYLGYTVRFGRKA